MIFTMTHLDTPKVHHICEPHSRSVISESRVSAILSLLFLSHLMF